MNPCKGFESYFLSFQGETTLELMNSAGLQARSGDKSAKVTGFTHLAFSLESEEAVDDLTRRLREDGYEVMTIGEVEKYLKDEGHLPWMTSLKQERKENGEVVDMTRMAFETVETAENLQLQIIELAKLVMSQQQEIEDLKARLNDGQ